MNIQDLREGCLFSDIDKEEVHRTIKEWVDEGKEDSYFDGLLKYMTDNDIDAEDIKKYVSPALQGILFYEVANRGLLNGVEKITHDIDDLL